MEAGPGTPRPYVVAHLAVSLDGSVTGFTPDLTRFYSLAAEWNEDATLAGADTILAQTEALSAATLPGPDPTGPLLAVVDSRRRVTSWNALREAGHWSRVVALRGKASATDTPVDEIATGGDRVNLSAALAELQGKHGIRRVRLDSGGTLVGTMLDSGLVDEVSLLIHPVLVPGHYRQPWWGGSDQPPPFSPTSGPEVRTAGGGLVQLRYWLNQPT